MTMHPDGTSAFHPLVVFNQVAGKGTGMRQLFSPAEDQRLRILVDQLGTASWKEIAKRMPNRTARQCRERYKNYLSPSVVNGPWTPEEDALLIEKVHELGVKWATIVRFFTSRSDVNIKNRWKTLVGKQQPKNIARIELPPDNQLSKPKQRLPPISSLDEHR